jgi:ligand-binding sensor domain-containing protein
LAQRLRPTRTPFALRAGLVAALTLVAFEAAALDPATSIRDYAVRVWREPAGLPHSHVRSIVQTRDGYLWIGTKGGLARFDGVRFTVFDDRKPDQLLDGEVWALQEDNDGALWIGTFGGGLSRYKDGRFTNYGKKEGLPSMFVGALAKCRDGAMWAGTDDKGIVRLEQDRLTAYSQKDGLLNDHVKSLYCDDRGTLWIGTTKGVSARSAGRFTNYPMNLQGDTRVTSIVRDGETGVWAGMLPRGLVHIAAGVVTSYEPTDGLLSNQIGGMYYDAHDTLWLATVQGLCRRRAGQFSCSSLEASTEAVATVALDELQAPMEDREGNLWVGSVNQGLIRFKDSEFIKYDGQQGMPLGTRVLLETPDGVKWIGGAGGLARLAGDQVTSYGTNEGLSSASIRTLFADAEGAIWVGSTIGLNVVREGKVEQIKEAGLDKAFIYGVLRDRRGDVWVGSDNGLYHGHDGHYRAYTPADGLVGSQIRCLREDSRGDIWIGSKDGGLTRWRDGQFTRFGTADGLAGDSVYSLYVDHENAVWVGTRRGLSRIQDGRITSYDARHGLPSNLIYQMIEDDAGDMWLTCNGGIFRIPRAQLAALVAGSADHVSAVSYGSEMGAGSGAQVITGYPSILKSHDASLWFANQSGVSVLNPSRRLAEGIVFPAWIEEVLIDGTVAAAGLRSFGPGARRVEIHYTALHLYAPEKMTFRYRLAGLDTQWTDADTRRVAYYTNLAPGSYRFEVEATNFKGVKAAQPVIFEFSLKPHFYQARWFQALAALGVVLLAFGAYRLRIARHERAEAELQRRVDEGVAKLDLLDGLLPICAWCKKVREDTGYWSQVEAYVSAHSRAQFSHGICPDCAKDVYGKARAGE